MNDLNWLHVLARWLHVLAAVVAVGGAVFWRCVLIPAAAALPDDAHTALRGAVRRRWARILGVAIALLLLTGLFNYLGVTAPVHRGQPLYHALMGVKIILALVVFFLASALVGAASVFEPIRRSAPAWAAVNILLAALVIALGCVLKFLPASPA